MEDVSFTVFSAKFEALEAAGLIRSSEAGEV